MNVIKSVLYTNRFCSNEKFREKRTLSILFFDKAVLSLDFYFTLLEMNGKKFHFQSIYDKEPTEKSFFVKICSTVIIFNEF